MFSHIVSELLRLDKTIFIEFSSQLYSNADNVPLSYFRIARGGLWYWYKPASVSHFLILGYAGVVIGTDTGRHAIHLVIFRNTWDRIVNCLIRSVFSFFMVRFQVAQPYRPGGSCKWPV